MKTINEDIVTAIQENIKIGKKKYQITSNNIFFLKELESLVCLDKIIDPSLTNSEKEKIFIRGTYDFLKLKNRTVGAFANKIIKHQNEIIEKEMNKYTLITSLSFRYFNKLNPLRIHGATITFHKSFPNRYNCPNVDLSNLRIYCSEYPLPNYTFIKIVLNARSSSSAMKEAESILNFILGTWNYALNFANRRMTSYNPPIHNIRFGPIFHIYAYKKKEEIAQYSNPHFYEETQNNKVKNKWDQIHLNFNRIRKKLKKYPDDYHDKIFELFGDYYLALESNKQDLNLIYLWAVLEKLTNGNKSEQVINRARAVTSKSTITPISLNAIRELRHHIAHKGAIVEGLDILLYSLKAHIDLLFRANLTHARRFESIEDFGKFLDYGIRKGNEIEAEIKDAKVALKYFPY